MTDYYVSLYGDDANDGQSPSTAWRSITKVQDTKFSPGSIIHFSGAWNQPLVFGSSGLTRYV